MANHEFTQVSGDRLCCRLSKTAQICLGVSLVVLIASVVTAGILLWPHAPLVWKGTPTTKYFPEIFLGRCLIYTQILRPEMSNLEKKGFISPNRCEVGHDFLLRKMTPELISYDSCSLRNYLEIDQSYPLLYVASTTEMDYLTVWRLEVKRGDLGRGGSCSDLDCKKILSTFKKAFISKNPCNITREDYEPLIKLVTQTIPCNKTLFWSKSKYLAHQYTWVEGKMFTLEDTLLGYIADDLSWCGDPNTSDMNYDSCPHWSENCPNNPVSVYWKAISKKEAACGVVQVMLNGSLSVPFYKNSTFGSVELFNLDPKKVHKLQAWVMHDIEADSSDSCSGSSINDLKLIVHQRNITFACQDNYRPVRFVQCVKNPEHPSCSSHM